MKTFSCLSAVAALVLASPVTLAQSHGAEYGAGVPAACSRLQPHLKLVNQTYVLPDPFKLLDGRPVRKKADWACRSAQLRTLFQQYELG